MTDAAAEPTGLGIDELTRLISEAAAVIHGPLSLEQKLAWVRALMEWQREVVDAQEFVVGERHAGIHNDNVVAVADGHGVHAELAQAA